MPEEIVQENPQANWRTGRSSKIEYAIEGIAGKLQECIENLQ